MQANYGLQRAKKNKPSSPTLPEETNEAAGFDDMQHEFQMDKLPSPIKGTPIRWFISYHITDIISIKFDPEDLIEETQDPDILLDVNNKDKDSDSDDSDDGSNNIHNIHTNGEDQPNPFNPSADDSCYSAVNLDGLPQGTQSGKEHEVLTQPQAAWALTNLTNLLYPRQIKGTGYTDPGFDRFKRS